jgi:hypothetical protein
LIEPPRKKKNQRHTNTMFNNNHPSGRGAPFQLDSNTLAALQQLSGGKQQQQQQGSSSANSGSLDLPSLLRHLGGGTPAAPTSQQSSNNHPTPVPVSAPSPPANPGFNLANALQSFATNGDASSNSNSQAGGGSGNLDLALLQQLGLLGGTNNNNRHNSNSNLLQQLSLLQQSTTGTSTVSSAPNRSSSNNGSNATVKPFPFSSTHAAGGSAPSRDDHTTPSVKFQQPPATEKHVVPIEAPKKKVKVDEQDDDGDHHPHLMSSRLKGVACAPGSVAIPCRARGVSLAILLFHHLLFHFRFITVLTLTFLLQTSSDAYGS